MLLMTQQSKGGFLMERCRAGLVLAVMLGMMGLTGVSAQLADDFSSGSYGTNGWQGDTSHFRFTSSSAIPPALRPALQLYAAGTGSSMIHAFQPFNTMMEWSAWVKLSFNPSASNFSRFYIAAMDGFPANKDQSIFVGIGMVDDVVGLYQHDGSQIITLITDSANIYNQSTNQVRFRVVMKNQLWYLETDPAGEASLATVDSVFLSAAFDTAVAAIFCQYTSSNSAKMYFDDVYCGPLNIDTTPPLLLASNITDPYQIALTFSEPLHESVATNNLSFEADNGIGFPLLCFFDPVNPAKIYLIFGEPFPDGISFNLIVRGVADMSGNIMKDTAISLMWYTAKRNDVVINEIMADPTPSVKLPDSEYIELCNRSSYPVSLCDWVLWIDNSRLPFPCISISPGSYTIIINEKDTALWSGYPEVITLQKLALRNDGACLALQDFRGSLVHAVCYDVKWHSTSFQADGGYSLELRDPANPCDHANTWRTSTDISCGTPGRPNSWPMNFPDLKAPYPVRVSVPDNQTVRVEFSEPIDTTVNMLNLFTIENSEGLFAGFALKPPVYSRIDYYLTDPLMPEMVYHLILTDTLRDCAGNYITFARLPFGIPALPDSLDLLFNEIMFRPADDGAEYVEFHNNSEKIIDLSFCMLARIDTLDMSVKDLWPLVDEPALLFPGEYAVITKERIKLLSKHQNAASSHVYLNSRMPALPDQGATYALLTHLGKMVDRVTYRSSYHAPGISDTKGIALERLSYDMPTEKQENWYSASKGSGWGTPTKRNSQHASAAITEAIAELHPKYFVPYSGGDNETAMIYLNGLAAGTFISIIIFDEAGRPVRHLLRESVAGSNDVYLWDGTSDSGALCQGGVYLVCVYLYHQQEGFQKFILPLVLLSK